ncbi:uncharacterized protein LOC108111919 isoform X1 [Drosophila eugracilis]|uniref:uncharacterized protein LOC108111919 isoform X1 n=2 Tax=Drosophila eugracilis TaxID=29029 RepID=UPI0007E5D99E|nr:uncharacterized protein LOC108111919 isoform X1 [Drosophila eugracilis]
MQKTNSFKSFIPVKIYQSVSAVYMTCISKMPRDSFKPKIDHSLLIEQAVVSAVDETLRPLDYEKRQQEAREILLKSQENLFEKMDVSQISSEKEALLTDDEDDGEIGNDPVRLKSQVLLDEYRKRYEDTSKTDITDVLPIKEIRQYAWLVLSLFLLACSVFVLVKCGNHNYFL